MAPLPTYTSSQLEAYLKRIGYIPGTKDRNALLEGVHHRIQTDALGTLCDLQRRHLAAIPWGNSGLHYSQHHTISLNAESLYEKMVDRRLDGYCMENSGLFFVVLRSLGYMVYATGGRVSYAAAKGLDVGLYLPLSTLGFGNNCATAPLPLEEGATATCIAPAEMRLVRDSITESIDQTQKVWIYQVRYNPDSNWLPMICFADVEFLPQDFGVMNFSVSQGRTSWFTQVFVCMRMILNSDGQEIIGQYVMSGKEVKRRIRGQTETLQEMHTEEDRIDALAKYFDMHLRDREIEGIRGLTSELK